MSSTDEVIAKTLALAKSQLGNYRTSVKKPTLEKHIEAHLVERVKRKGGIAYKFTSPQRRSVPDRLVLLPGGLIRFAELKAPGKKPTELQEREHARLRALGFTVDVIDSKEGVDALYPK